MKPLHKRQKNNVVPKAEPGSLLCSNNDDVMLGSAFGFQKNTFSEETIKSLQELGLVLQAIHNRLLADGCALNEE